MVIAPLVLGRTIIATVWAMLAGVQVNPAPLKNDRAKGEEERSSGSLVANWCAGQDPEGVRKEKWT